MSQLGELSRQYQIALEHDRCARGLLNFDAQERAGEELKLAAAALWSAWAETVWQRRY